MIKQALNYIYIHWFFITTSLTILVIIASLSPVTALDGLDKSDKLFHIIAYFSLSFPTAFRKKYSYILIFIWFFLFGVTIEAIQPYFERNYELDDIFANSLGALLGIFFADLIKKYYSY